MAILARFQRTATTEAGIIVPGASFEVRRESDNGLPALFSDRSGLVSMLNPSTADAEGLVAFHVVGGVYKITVTSGSFSRTWRYVGIGTAQEFDVEQLTITDANLVDMPAATVKGRAFGAGTGDPGNLTATQIRDILHTIGTSLFGADRVMGLSSTPTNLTATDSGKVILNSGATRTVNLPAPAAGLCFAFIHTSTGVLTVDTPGAENIFFPDGSIVSNFTLSTVTGGAAILVSDGFNWVAFATDINRILATVTEEGVVELATAAEYRANTPARALNNNEVWASADLVALTDAATIAVDFAAGYNFSVTLAGNRTLGNPSSTKNGQTGAIVVNQDATGSRTLAYSANWEFATGVAPVLSTAPNTKDVLFYFTQSSTSVVVTGLLKGVA
jgi:hypothetical protein